MKIFTQTSFAPSNLQYQSSVLWKSATKAAMKDMRGDFAGKFLKTS